MLGTRDEGKSASNSFSIKEEAFLRILAWARREKKSPCTSQRPKERGFKVGESGREEKRFTTRGEGEIGARQKREGKGEGVSLRWKIKRECSTSPQ